MSVESKEKLSLKSVAGAIAVCSMAAGAMYYLIGHENENVEEIVEVDSTKTPKLVISKPIPAPLPVFNCKFDDEAFKYFILAEAEINDLGIPTPVCKESPIGTIYPVQL